MSEASMKKILSGALKLLEKGWCQGSYAKINGTPCMANNKFATHFDLLGAMHRAAGTKIVWSETIWDYFDPKVAKNPGKWNDHPKRTQDQVVSAVREALEKIGKENES